MKSVIYSSMFSIYSIMFIPKNHCIKLIKVREILLFLSSETSILIRTKRNNCVLTYLKVSLQSSQLDRPRGLEATHEAESFTETHLLESGVLSNPYINIPFPS